MAQAWNLKGLVLMKMDRDQEALNSFEKAVSLDPSKKEYQDNRNLVQKAAVKPIEKKLSFSSD
jgi:Flp pilus assembly protein TadD